MLVKGDHTRQLIGLFIIWLLIIAGVVFVCIRGELPEQIILAVLAVVLTGLFLFNYGMTSRQYRVDEQGITVIWFEKWSFLHRWESYSFLEKNTVVPLLYEYRSYDAFICSRIPLKKRWINQEKGYCVMADWIQKHPIQVNEIKLNDLKPGQEEQFWNHVPDRLKTVTTA